eukprot:m51a1_g5916 hypothetical protein (472) ;mRNA; r:37685-41009
MLRFVLAIVLTSWMWGPVAAQHLHSHGHIMHRYAQTPLGQGKSARAEAWVGAEHAAATEDAGFILLPRIGFGAEGVVLGTAGDIAAMAGDWFGASWMSATVCSATTEEQKISRASAMFQSMWVRTTYEDQDHINRLLSNFKLEWDAAQAVLQKNKSDNDGLWEAITSLGNQRWGATNALLYGNMALFNIDHFGSCAVQMYKTLHANDSWKAYGDRLYFCDANEQNRKPMSMVSDTTIMVLKRVEASSMSYMIAISGTNPFSAFNWVFEDLDVEEVVPCLGGALASTFALRLEEMKGMWDPGNRASVHCVTFGAQTAGNASWASYFDGMLGNRSKRYVNTLDVVPHAWEDSSMEDIPSIYAPTISVPKEVEMVLKASRAIWRKNSYQQPSKGLCPFRGPEPESRRSFVVEMTVQHILPYLQFLGCDGLGPLYTRRVPLFESLFLDTAGSGSFHNVVSAALETAVARFIELSR